MDISDGLGHRECFGEDREGYCNLETGEPLGDGDPIPTGWPYEADEPTPEPEKDGPEVVATAWKFMGERRVDFTVALDKREIEQGRVTEIEPLIRLSDYEALRAERDAAQTKLSDRVSNLEQALSRIERAIGAGITENGGEKHRVKISDNTRIEDGWLVGEFADQFREIMRTIHDIARAALKGQSDE